jgi:MFS family permease
LRLLATLRGISFLGDAVALVALFLRISHHGHPWNIAALSIAASLPFVLLAPVAGVVVDSVSAKHLLSALCGAQALVCVALGWWHATAITIALMALLSCGGAFAYPGYTALVPTITGEENIASGQSTMQAVQGVASTAGPAVGGLLVGLFGQSWPFYVDALSFVVAGVATLLLTTDRRPEPGHARPDKGDREMRAGMRLLIGDPVLLPLVICVTVFFLAYSMVNVAEVFFTTKTLHGTPLMYGFVGTSFGVGSVAGAIGARRLDQSPVHLVRAALVGILIVSVSVGTVGLVEHVGSMYPLLFVSGIAVGVANVAFLTLYAVRVDEAQRGRVFAAIGALFTSAEIGATAIGGLILTVIAPRTVFQIAGVACTLTALTLGPITLRASQRAQRAEQST